MGPQCYLLLLGAILLSPATCLTGRHHRINKTGKYRTRARSSLADPTDIVCALGRSSEDCLDPTNLCGIDKATGEVQGCVPASQCPPSTGKTLSCDPGKPSCCCLNTQEDDYLCNDVWEDTSKCKQACSLPELKNFDFCTLDFSKYVVCANDYNYHDFCFTDEYCGIERTTGKLQGCIKPKECPAGAKGSKKVVCDPTKPSCCCQEISSDSGPELDIECNNIWNLEDTSVRQQACLLPELKDLALCKADPTKRVYCARIDSWGDLETEECRPWEMCGIDKVDGKMKHCVDASECPANAFGSDKIVCDSSSPNCCCQKPVDSDDNGHLCNNIRNDRDSSIWQEACKLPELSSLSVCQNDPTKELSCSDQSSTSKCEPSQFCGIDKKDGEMHKCLDASQCPANAKGSEKVVCDAKAPFCCCQKVENKHGSAGYSCNNILKKEDSSIWQQACSLPELKNLTICQEDPTKRVTCAYEDDYDYDEVDKETCKPSEFCGIDKKDGKMQQCLEASQCPAGAKGSDKVVCDSKSPYCCCQKLENKYYDSEHACNNILSKEDSSIWQQACSLPELKNLPVCQDDPNNQVVCAYERSTDWVQREGCKFSEFCGIDKKDGKLFKCLDGSQCPAGAKGSDKVVCDSSSPYCCCQKLERKDEPGHPCNHIKNRGDGKVWKQACSLPELKNLPVCQEDPSKHIMCSHHHDGQVVTSECTSSKFCGIDKSNGELTKCLTTSECPAGAKGSLKIVCDDTSPFCCCQKVVDVHSDWDTCNDVADRWDNTIWKQACSLPQLRDLPFCEDDPTKGVYCTYQDPVSGEGIKTGCRPSKFCGIDKTNGEMKYCVDRSECPAGAKDSVKIVCDDSAPYCCCQNVEGRHDKRIFCNDILDWEDTSIWKQACSLPQLKKLDFCKAKPTKPTTTTTTEPPPPTAPPTPTPPPTTPAPVKPEDMDSECLNFCKEEKPDDHPYLFRVYCGDAKTENTCPSPCPSACGKFCWDGRHMECPPLGGGPPPPPPRESEPSRGTHYTDLSSWSSESEAGFYTVFTIISLLVLLIFAGCIYLCCMSSGTVVAPLPFAAQQQMQQQAYQPKAFNSSTAATSSGTSLSSSESSLSSIAIKR